MARKKVTIERKPIKPVKKKRNLSEETKEKLRARLAEMRAKKKPAEYKNVSKKVLELPDDDTYSFKNVKEWIRETKDQISASNTQARGRGVTPLDRQKASNFADGKKAYIRYCEHYLRTGDWIGIFSGKHEEHKVTPTCVAMAYYPDGTPKRSVGVFYKDIGVVWTNNMDESEYVTQENREYVYTETVALTDTQFTGEV